MATGYRLDPISQFSAEMLGIAIYNLGVLTDADGDVNITIVRDIDSAVVLASTVADHSLLPADVGLYSWQLETPQVADKGEYTATWDYIISGDPRTFVTRYSVVPQQFYWDTFDAKLRNVVMNVYHKVSNGWDSGPEGGPYIWELDNVNFEFETIARLMATDALTYINFTQTPAFDPPFEVGNGVKKPFPPGWYGLLERATAMELYRHLARSYLEQPDPQNVPEARLDRQRYYDRWNEEAEREQKIVDKMLTQLKRKYRTGAKSRSLLVAGNMFPLSYINPASPRYPFVPTTF